MEKIKSKIILVILLVCSIFLLSIIANKAYAFSYYSYEVKGLEYEKSTLYLNIHPTEQLIATIKKDGEEVSNPNITWVSSNDEIATVDQTGKITAKKEGSAVITITFNFEDDESKSIEWDVSVYNEPKFTDLSNAKYDIILNGIDSDIQISNIKTDSESSYYYIITPNNAKPNLNLEENKSFDYKKNNNAGLLIKKDKGLEIDDFDKYFELNQDLYLWVVESKKLEKPYYVSVNGNQRASISIETRIINNGYKLTRPELPSYTGCFFATFASEDRTQLILNRIPCATQRKFTIKIGKISDYNILNKIKNGENDAFSLLEKYAKENSAIYEEKVKSTAENKLEYEGDFSLPLKGKLVKGEYYYLYIILDDEDEKYYPVNHCLTLAEANAFDDGWWSLSFYGDDSFNWREFETTENKSDNTDNTTAKGNLPNTGKSNLLYSTITLIAFSLIMYFKNKKYKNI